eukprot:TRINITY_DN4496_c0_g1_i1.p1 TRINITY_DN4496_c0_g1~~TRINITY_DN4496_c0_g1_i1.p1  ORF type:complete len:586 (-),score=128.53 TRINITY_DN4496_c0_g1_i1:48-1805(-)
MTSVLQRFARKSSTSSDIIAKCRAFVTMIEPKPSKKTETLYGGRKLPLYLSYIAGGSTALALGYVFYDQMNDFLTKPDPSWQKKKIVVVGSGWSSVGFLQTIDTRYYDVTVIAPRNYFLFTPLLPSVTVGTIEPRSVTESIRKISQLQKGDACTFYEATCTDVEPTKNSVTCQAKDLDGNPKEFKVNYDHLILAVGAVNNTFGTPGVYENCYFLKELEDAIEIRKKILDCFETAELPTEDKEIDRLLHFVVVGGGPNGVEFAAELRDFVTENLYSAFPKSQGKVKITLVELLDHILSTYDAKISEFTEKHFKRTDIDVKTKYQVTEVTPKEVVTRNMETKEILKIPFGLCVWATGLGPSKLVALFMDKFPGEQTNRRGILTDEKMRVKGSNNIWALGDCSTIEQKRLINHFNHLFEEADVNKDGFLSISEFQNLLTEQIPHYPQLEFYAKKFEELFERADANRDGKVSLEEFKNIVAFVDARVKMLPQTAQVASQQGYYLGTSFNSEARNLPVFPFRYRHMGSLAYVGDHYAVADLNKSIAFGGFGAGWLWKSVYLSKQYSMKNKVLVAFDWTKTKIFGRDLTRN